MKVGPSVYSVFTSILLMFSLVFFVSGLLSVIMSSSLVIEWEVWGVRTFLVSMSVVFDWMSLIFLGSVCLISGCVMKYSQYYMEGEKNLTRFVYILLLFVVSMWFLISSPNIVSLLLGWDGLGLTSYALVIFYQNESSCNAGMLTVLSNRVGDVAILMSIALMVSSGSSDFYGILPPNNMGLAFLVILAAATKSAQVPFSAWLPAAMAAPTPVSALVHSSTLVTAGVYLLIRFSPLVVEGGFSGPLLAVAIVTVIMAGAGALFEMDMKKVVALSTLSQLGLMIMTISVGMKELAFFHLISHAMFKSTLFMCVGVMIHLASGDQNSRAMSGVSISSPSLGLVLGASNLALCGLPFMAGFYSKDALLEGLFSSSLNFGVVLMVVVGSGLTVSYSLRLLYLSAVKVEKSSSLGQTSDMEWLVMKSVSILFFMSILSGFWVHWVAVPVMSPFYLSDWAKLFVPGVSLVAGVSLYSFIQKNYLVSSASLKLSEGLISGMWFLPFLSTKFISLVSMMYGQTGNKLVEMGWLEYYGGQGARPQFVLLSSFMQKGQNSLMVSGYSLTVVVCSLVLLSMS